MIKKIAIMMAQLQQMKTNSIKTKANSKVKYFSQAIDFFI